MKPDNIILEGITGSIAYGMDHAASDEDIKGVFVAPTEMFLGLHKPPETIDHVDPDYCYHEIGKFLRLALAGNPTILEMLFLTHYTSFSGAGFKLVHNRDRFLSNRVRNTYGGYAMAQLKRLMERNDGSFSSNTRKRYSKHARHCFRLLQQGRALMETGTLTVRVPNRDELFTIGELEPAALSERFEEEWEKFNATESVLPNEPDTEFANDMLISIRKNYL